MITVAEHGRGFEKDGKPFFYLADTCWSAFTNIGPEEWAFYLKRRREQGFRVLQINILPQWDACATPYRYYPLPTADGIHFSFTEWQPAYFERARQMCLEAKDQGFELALAVLWSNYVPGTWSSTKIPENQMPFSFLESYLERVHSTFSDLNPIYLISGDTDFCPQANEYYAFALQYLKAHAPQCLYTFHIRGRDTALPQQFADQIDFYMYQSGHNAQPENQKMPWYLAQEFCAKQPVRPVLNAEPCYEQMGYSRGMYGRFSRFDVRRAAWQSILSGACAGIAYGAAGIYAWEKTGYRAPMSSENFDTPNPWNQALDYPGAWDYGFIPFLLGQLGIARLEPRQDLIAAKEGMRCAWDPDNHTVLIYAPYNTAVQLTMPIAGHRVWVLDLEQHRVCTGLDRSENETGTKLGLHPFLQDVLIVLQEEHNGRESV